MFYSGAIYPVSLLLVAVIRQQLSTDRSTGRLDIYGVVETSQMATDYKWTITTSKAGKQLIHGPSSSTWSLPKYTIIPNHSIHTETPFPQLNKSPLPLSIHSLDLLHPSHEPASVVPNHIDQLLECFNERVLNISASSHSTNVDSGCHTP